MPLTPLICNEQQHVNVHSFVFVYISHFSNAFHDLRTNIPHKHHFCFLVNTDPMDQCFPTCFGLLYNHISKGQLLFYWYQARNVFLLSSILLEIICQFQSLFSHQLAASVISSSFMSFGCSSNHK